MPTDHPLPPHQTIEQAFADPDLPDYLHDFLRESLLRDPYLAYYDAQIAADLLKAHYERSKRNAQRKS